MTLQAGTAVRTINPKVGDDLCGQLERRICDRIRDDLEANLLYLADGRTQILLISLDLLFVETADVRATGAAIEARTGIPARNVLLCCTHTHAGPNTVPLLHDAPKNVAYVARLKDALLDGAAEAVAAARPASVGWGLGAAHVGFNRRLCFADGSHTMYGDTQRPDFTGLEGPDDPSHAALFVRDAATGDLVAIAHHNTCHATCVEGAEFASADFPGEARRRLREKLGADLPVLYLQGASGDTSPWDMFRAPSRYEPEQRLTEVGKTVADETLRLLSRAVFTDSPALQHAFDDLTLAVRLPSDADLDLARRVSDQGEEAAGRWQYVLQVSGVLRLHETYKDNPADTLAVHGLRIGDFAVATNPCEFYCQFGLDIKRRSPAPITAIAQLADGFSGYCPTIPAILGGGYSGQAIHWCRLEPYAGYKLVETSARLLHRLWKPKSL